MVPWLHFHPILTYYKHFSWKLGRDIILHSVRFDNCYYSCLHNTHHQIISFGMTMVGCCRRIWEHTLERSPTAALGLVATGGEIINVIIVNMLSSLGSHVQTSWHDTGEDIQGTNLSAAGSLAHSWKFWPNVGSQNENFASITPKISIGNK